MKLDASRSAASGEWLETEDLGIVALQHLRCNIVHRAADLVVLLIVSIHLTHDKSSGRARLGGCGAARLRG